MLNQDEIVINMDTHDSEGNISGSVKTTVSRDMLEQVFNQAARVTLHADSDHTPLNEQRLINAVDELTNIVNEATIQSTVKEN